MGMKVEGRPRFPFFGVAHGYALYTTHNSDRY